MSRYICSEGHRREDRWLLSSDDDGSSSRSSRSCCDVARTPPQAPVPTPTPAPTPAPVEARRAPAASRLGPRSEVHRSSAAARGPDSDGWLQPRRGRHQRPRSPRADPRPRRRRSLTPDMDGDLCFRCLEPGHVVRDCTNKIRCRRCLLSCHSTRGCTPERRAHDREQARRASNAAPRPQPRHASPASQASPPPLQLAIMAPTAQDAPASTIPPSAATARRLCSRELSTSWLQRAC
jgi:hypothetical protein